VGRILLQSDSTQKERGCSAALVMIGQGYLRKSEYVVLKRQEFSLDIPALEEVRWESKLFKCSYDPDYGGYRYGGYVLVLENCAEKIVFTRSSKTLWERIARNVIEAELELGYDRDFTSGEELWTIDGLPDSVR
jgi:hypothetical protein